MGLGLGLGVTLTWPPFWPHFCALAGLPPFCGAWPFCAPFCWLFGCWPLF